MPDTKNKEGKSKRQSDCGKPLAIDLFCGAGGMSTGFEMAGFEVLLGIEQTEVFGKTFSLNHSSAELICGDIREVSIETINEIIKGRHISVICGGPPCQGFSGAGRRDRNDPRNSLFMDFVRIVDGVRQDYFVMENVPGILNMKTARGEMVTTIIESEFRKIGYRVECRKLLAADFGVPQQRRRVIFIGTADDHPLDYPEPTHAEEAYKTLWGTVERWVGAGSVLLPKNKVPKNYFHSQKSIDGFIRRKENNLKKGKGFGWQIIDPDKPCYTITSRYWKDGSDALVKYSDTEIRYLTEKEAAAIQTFPPDYEFCGSKKDVFTQIGNAVPCLLAKAIAVTLMKVNKPIK